MLRCSFLFKTVISTSEIATKLSIGFQNNLNVVILLNTVIHTVSLLTMKLPYSSRSGQLYCFYNILCTNINVALWPKKNYITAYSKDFSINKFSKKSYEVVQSNKLIYTNHSLLSSSKMTCNCNSVYRVNLDCLTQLHHQKLVNVIDKDTSAVRKFSISPDYSSVF